jgi:hydroxyethylthiazole kinase
MRITPQSLWADLSAIRKKAPLIHNIINYFVMEHTANCLLAIGASPIMAHATEEVTEMVARADGLVLNIGTICPNWQTSMLQALKAADKMKIPVVFDPVGVGATLYRKYVSETILQTRNVSVVRGNCNEICTLSGIELPSKGVDSNLNPVDYLDHAQTLADTSSCIVVMSGIIDVITDGKETYQIRNGHPLMTKVTGMGCAATALTGAFASVNTNQLLACAHAAALMGIAGEMTAQKVDAPGSFKQGFIDILYSITLADLKKTLRVETL